VSFSFSPPERDKHLEQVTKFLLTQKISQLVSQEAVLEGKRRVRYFTGGRSCPFFLNWGKWKLTPWSLPSFPHGSPPPFSCCCCYCCSYSHCCCASCSAVNYVLLHIWILSVKEVKGAVTAESFKAKFPGESPNVLLDHLVEYGYFLATKDMEKPGYVETTTLSFSNDGLKLVIEYEDPVAKKWALIKGLLVLFGIFLIVLYPVWPEDLRVAGWYVLVVLTVVLASILALTLLRTPIFSATRLVVAPGIWVLPKFDREDVGFYDQFSPLWQWGRPEEEKAPKEEETPGKEDKTKANLGSSVKPDAQQKKKKKN